MDLSSNLNVWADFQSYKHSNVHIITMFIETKELIGVWSVDLVEKGLQLWSSVFGRKTLSPNVFLSRKGSSSYALRLPSTHAQIP